MRRKASLRLKQVRRLCKCLPVIVITFKPHLCKVPKLHGETELKLSLHLDPGFCFGRIHTACEHRAKGGGAGAAGGTVLGGECEPPILCLLEPLG